MAAPPNSEAYRPIMGFYFVNVLLCIFSLGFFYWMTEVDHTSIEMGDDVLPLLGYPKKPQAFFSGLYIFFILLENIKKKRNQLS